MQLLPPLTSKASAAQREQPSGKHLPYARHVDDHTIETRDGLLMQVIQVRGLLFETADTDEINYRKRLRDAALQAIGSSRYRTVQKVNCHGITEILFAVLQSPGCDSWLAPLLKESGGRWTHSFLKFSSTRPLACAGRARGFAAFGAFRAPLPRTLANIRHAGPSRPRARRGASLANFRRCPAKEHPPAAVGSRINASRE